MTKWTRTWDTLLFSGIALLIVLGLGGALLLRYLDPVNAETRRLQGDWELVRVDENGEEAHAGFFKGIYCVRGDRVTIGSAGKDEFCRIQVNPRVRPKEIDLIYQNKEEGREESVLGVYDLEGDRLTICSYFLSSESPRPTEVDGKNGGLVAYLKRKK